MKVGWGRMGVGWGPDGPDGTRMETGWKPDGKLDNPLFFIR